MSVNKDNVQVVTYKPGDYILREGAMCDALLVVKSGQIEIFRFDKQKNKIPLAIVNSGEYLGEMSLVSDRPHSANAMALTETTCLKISHDVLEMQMKTAPTWLVALTRGLVMKLYKTNELLKRNKIVDESLYSAVKAIEERQAADLLRAERQKSKGEETDAKKAS